MNWIAGLLGVGWGLLGIGMLMIVPTGASWITWWGNAWRHRPNSPILLTALTAACILAGAFLIGATT